MPKSAQGEEPGFETDVNELSKDNKGPEASVEEKPQSQEAEASETLKAQKEAAQERKEGGYQ